MSAEDLRFPTLGHAISGHLMTGVVKGLLALVLVWVCTWFINTDSGFSQLVLALFASYVISEIMSAIIARPIVLKRNRSNPGGLAYVTLPLTASMVITFVSTYAVTRSMTDTVLITAVVTCINTAEVVWMKAWVPGPTPEEEHATFQEFKSMTKDYFADDVAEIKRRAGQKAREKYYMKKAREEEKERKKKNEL